MDNLQHIDDLLKRASQEPANALVNDSDWEVIEKKLKRRKIRIYAIWIFLALVVSTTSIMLVNSTLLFRESKKTFVKQPSVSIDDPIKEDKSNLLQSKENNASEKGINHSLPIQTRANNRRKVTSSADDNVEIFTPLVGNKEKTKNLINKSIAEEPTDEITDRYSLQLTAHQIKDIKVNLTYNLLDKVDLEQLNKASDLKKHTLKSTNSNYFEIGYSFTPSISSKMLSENSSLSGLINKDYYDKVAANESSAFASSTGINIQYHNKTPFYVSSGLYLTQRTESVDYNYIIDSAPAINATSFAEIDGYFPIVPESVVYTGSNSYHFVEIPLNVGYKQAISRNFEMRTEVGVSYLALMTTQGKKSDATFLRLRDITELNLRTRNIAASISSGVYYNTSRFAIGLEPTFSLNLNSITSNEYQNELDQNVTGNPIQVRPYNYGFNISTNFKLNNK